MWSINVPFLYRTGVALRALTSEQRPFLFLPRTCVSILMRKFASACRLTAVTGYAFYVHANLKVSSDFS